jgi:hypothetical protein
MSQSLEVEAAKRKERLALLRQKKGSAVGAQEQQQEDDDDEPTTKKYGLLALFGFIFTCRPTFRSYAPISEDLSNIERKSQATPLDITPEIREHLERTKDTKVADEIVRVCECACTHASPAGPHHACTAQGRLGFET